jgi:putative DNA primase/helicase
MPKSKLPKAKKIKARDFPHSDAGNAELFTALKASNVRYDHRQGRWLIWNVKSNRWTPDMGHKVRLLAINAARFRLRESANISDGDASKSEANWALQSENRHRLDSALEIAKSLSPICDDGQGWDSDPWSFGVDNGIVDLRTGKLKEATQQDKLTKFSPLKFDPDAKCPRFEGFLNQIFDGDSELIRFIYKAVGYCLSGSVSEQCMFCCHGSGANGKSTFFAALKYVLGDYGTNLPFSALELKGRSSIPNDLVMLVGRRFATAIETQEGVRLNEARIKALTGGDTITARRLYHEHFEFDPTHKI